MARDDAGAGPSTRAVHAGEPPADLYGPVVNPIVLSTTFFSDPDGGGPVLYQRYANAPNQVLLSERLAALEGAEDALVFGSGMAAMACALLSLLRAGDHVVATDASTAAPARSWRPSCRGWGSRPPSSTSSPTGGRTPSGPTPASWSARARPTRCSESSISSRSATRRTRAARW